MKELLKFRDKGNTQNNMQPERLRLRRCDLSICEAMCCHDGVFLNDRDEERIQAAIIGNPKLFEFLPPVPVIDAERPLEDGSTEPARRTAVAPYEYKNPEFPQHFSRTRCVFALPDHRCSLQVAASEQGEDPWKYKPRACWMHPIAFTFAGDAVAPAVHTRDDIARTKNYPGYYSYTECGRHRPLPQKGAPWRETLSLEVKRLSEEGIYVYDLLPGRLIDETEILFEGRPALPSDIRWIALALGMIILPMISRIAIPIAYPQLSKMAELRSGYTMLSVFGVIAALVITARALLKRKRFMNEHHVITNRGVELTQGLWRPKLVRLKYSDIAEVSWKQSRAQKRMRSPNADLFIKTFHGRIHVLNNDPQAEAKFQQIAEFIS